MLCRLLGFSLFPCIDDAKSFFETLGMILKEGYSIPIHQEHLKVFSRCVADVVRYLSLTNPPLVSRWFDFMKGQPGLIAEGLHAMLEVAAGMFLKPVFIPAPQVQGCLLSYSLFTTLIAGDATFTVILLSWARTSVKQREGRWLAQPLPAVIQNPCSDVTPPGLVGEVKEKVKSKVNPNWAEHPSGDKGNNNNNNDIRA